MIIGSGSIAGMLNDREGITFFAAGVGDSQCIDVNEYMKEVARFYSLSHNNMIVYFSSISIFIADTLYIRHKKLMEEHVRHTCVNYTIIRIGNIWECTNPNTFINKMQYWKRNEKLTDGVIRDEWKYMISKDQLNFVTDNLPLKGKIEISIFGEMKKVIDCI